MACAPTRPREWPELSWDQPSSLRGTERLQWVDMRPTRWAARGHEPPFKCGVARTFKGRLHPVTGHPIVKDERSVVGHCRLLFVEGYVRSLPLTNRASPRPKDRS